METQVLKINNNSLSLAKDLIYKDQLVAFPTETVYGLGGLGTSTKAIETIYKVKGRPSDNPLIAHVHTDYDLESLIKINHSYVYDLVKKFMPGPLTIVGLSKGVVKKEATCNLDSLAVRMPMHSGAQAFLKEVNAPIVAPSANISKHTSAVTSEHVFADFNGKIPLILDGGKCVGGIESTVLNVMNKTPIILRTGLITKEMLEATLNKKVDVCDTLKENERVASPGVKYSHYRPNCQTKLFNYDQINIVQEYYDSCLLEQKNPYILCDDILAQNFKGLNVLNLGKTANEMASNLYYLLRQGEMVADIIIGIIPQGEGGVYDGVKNRLKKACI